MPRRYLVFAVLLLFTVCGGIYANGLRGSFQLDDFTSIVENPAVHRLDPRGWWAFWPTRVLTYASFAFDHALHGLNVVGYHVTSLLVHAGAACMVLWLVYGLLRAAHPARAELLPALSAALLFATHPLQTQAVVYVVQRAAALAACFYLGSVAAYVQALRRGRTHTRLLALALALGALAQLCKETAVTLPAAVLLVDLAVAPTPGRWRRVLPFLPLAAIVPLIAAAEHRFGVAGGGLAAQTERVSHWTYWLTQWEVVLRYLRLIVLPVGQNVDHEIAWRTSLAARDTWLLAGAHGLLLGVAIFAFRRGHRLAALSIAWFYLTLLPESSVFPILDPMFEHRLYLPMLGPALAFGLMIDEIAARRRRLAVGTVVAVSVVLSSLTVARNRVWATPESLWSDAAAKSPGKARPHVGLGVAYGQQGRLREAKIELERAVSLDPGSSRAWLNLGNVELASGDPIAAARAYRRAIEIRPDATKAWYNLGVCLDRAGDLDGAARAYQRTLELDPRQGLAYVGLSGVRLRQGRAGEALELWQRGAALGQAPAPLRRRIEEALASGPVKSP